MLIKGTPSMLAPPSNPLGFSGLSLSGSLGYVDTTPRPAYDGRSEWQDFQQSVFFWNLSNRTAPGHMANINGSYYDPAAWGGSAVVRLHQRDLLAHWKRVLASFPGSTWNDIALAYGVPLATIEDFAKSANASSFEAIRRVWQNPFIDDDVKRRALGLIVRRLELSPWEWASVIGMSEAAAVEILNVPVPTVAQTSYLGVTPAVQATAESPGFVVDIGTGSVGVIPAGSEPFLDASFYAGDNVGGARGFYLKYPGPNEAPFWGFMDVVLPIDAPSLNVPITPELWAEIKALFYKHIANPDEGFDRQIAGIAQQRGWSEEDLAAGIGLTVSALRSYIDFRGGVMNIPEERQVFLTSELPELVMPSESALQPIEPVFFFDLPTGFNTGPASEKAALYLSKIDEGFTDAQIRITVESALGPQDDSGWTALRNLAAAQRAAEIAARAAADAAAAAAAAQDQANAVVAADPQSSAAVTTAQAADQAATAAAVADNAATIAVESVNTAAAAADAGDSAGSVQASTAAINASTTATDAAAAAGGVSETPANAATVANVTQAYRDILKRMPDAAGLEFYTTGGFTIDQVIADMKASPEFKAISTVITPAAGGALAPLLLAVAAAVILGG